MSHYADTFRKLQPALRPLSTHHVEQMLDTAAIQLAECRARNNVMEVALKEMLAATAIYEPPAINDRLKKARTAAHTALAKAGV